MSLIIDYTSTEDSTSVFYTVTAGKTLYLCSVWVSWAHRGDTMSAVQLYYRDDVDAMVARLFINYPNPGSVGAWSQSYPVPLAIAAGYDMVLKGGDPGLLVNGGFTGYEL